MKTELIPLKRFPNKELAEAYLQILQENGIECRIGDNLATVDITFSNSRTNDQYEILIHNEDLDKAQKILRNQSEKEIEDLPNDYYLFSFTDDELIDLLAHPNDWNDLDQILAEKLVKERGLKLTKEDISDIQKNDVQKNQHTDKTPIGRLVFCYIFIVLAFFKGILVIFLAFILAQGYFFWKGTKTLPDGSKMFQYSKSVRNQGQFIFITSLIILGLLIIGFLFTLLTGKSINDFSLF